MSRFINPVLFLNLLADEADMGDTIISPGPSGVGGRSEYGDIPSDNDRERLDFGVAIGGVFSRSLIPVILTSPRPPVDDLRVFLRPFLGNGAARVRLFLMITVAGEAACPVVATAAITAVGVRTLRPGVRPIFFATLALLVMAFFDLGDFLATGIFFAAEMPVLTISAQVFGFLADFGVFLADSDAAD